MVAQIQILFCSLFWAVDAVDHTAEFLRRMILQNAQGVGVGITDMEVSSLKKKFKDKKFAAGCSRDTIRQGAEMLGWELETLMEGTIRAMAATEAEMLSELEKLTADA